MRYADLSNSKFISTDFYKSKLLGAILSNSDFSYARFLRSNMRDVVIENTIFTEAIQPNGQKYE
jgi:uncharacterized protein YjbI with pentapeptide repeats